MEMYNELQKLYRRNKQRYNRFLEQAVDRGKSNDAKELFSHLSYNLLLARVNADVAVDSTEYLAKGGLLFSGNMPQIESALRLIGYRFPNRAVWICDNRERFFESHREIGIVTLVHRLSAMHPIDARNILAGGVEGMDMKAASHFLRGLGLSHNELAILDVYILEWLLKFNVIDEVPKYLSKNEYLVIERKMKYWNNHNIHIPLDVFDLLLWELGRGDN